MSHTPGPWTAGIDGNLRVYGPNGQGENSGLIANVFKGRDNVNLIVAAPDLLAALKLLLPMAQAFEKQASQGSGGRRGGQVFTKARAAIAKAEGIEP